RVLGLDAGERHDVALGAANGLLLELLEAARARGLGEDRERQEQSGEGGQPHSAISTMHSISTGMPIGSEPMPTAERACLPRSPNTSTNRSEQPLITFGWSWNSAVALTMPSSFTTRATRSRLPSSARITARRSMPTVRACW